MIIDIFNEILWPHFIQLDHVRNLSLKEQTELYTEYVDELETQRIAYYNWLNENVYKGDQFTNNLGNNFIVQENFELLLQENIGQIIDPNAPAGDLGILIE